MLLLSSLLFTLPLLSTFHLSWPVRLIALLVFVISARRAEDGLIVVSGLLPLATPLGLLTVPAMSGTQVGELLLLPLLAAATARHALRPSTAPTCFELAVAAGSSVIVGATVVQLARDGHSVAFEWTDLWSHVTTGYLRDAASYRALHDGMVWLEGIVLAYVTYLPAARWLDDRLITGGDDYVESVTTLEATPPRAERWTAQWKELYAEVITTGLCTGCAGCVVTCPHDVIGYEHAEGKYVPFHLEDELGPADCIHGVKGCTTCTRACPRFRSWEPAADLHLFGRVREPDELAGIWRQLLLTRAADDTEHERGQDGGFVSAMLCWLLDHDYVEGALVSGVEPDDAWKARPVLVRTRDEVLATAGSRYTYCANPLGYATPKRRGCPVWRWSGWAAKPLRRR